MMALTARHLEKKGGCSVYLRGDPPRVKNCVFKKLQKAAQKLTVANS